VNINRIKSSSVIQAVVHSQSRFFGILHQTLYQLTGGIIGGRFRGRRVLLLTTRGRKSGKPRTTPLMYFQDGERIFVVGSNSGLDTHPGWYLNLASDPLVHLQLKARQMDVRAETAGSQDWDRLWQIVVATAPFYNSYRKSTQRKIPLVYLDPITEKNKSERQN
jgi:deazaflavin-dependent oxidoreductase (nitroreductase family)